MNVAGWIDLTDKVAHVTGVAHGIGAAIARALAGASVIVSDVDLEDAGRVAEELPGTAMVLEVSDRAAVDAAFEATVRRSGSLAILVNNAPAEIRWQIPLPIGWRGCRPGTGAKPWSRARRGCFSLRRSLISSPAFVCRWMGDGCCCERAGACVARSQGQPWTAKVRKVRGGLRYHDGPCSAVKAVMAG